MPLQMTRAEYEATYGVKPVVSSSKLDTTPAPIRMTRAEYDETYGTKPTSPTLTDSLKGRYLEAVDGVRENIGKAVTGDKISQARVFMRPVGAVARAGADVIGAGVSAVLPDKVEEAIQKVTDPIVSPVVERFARFEERFPTEAQDIKDLLSVAQFAPVGAVARPVTAPVRKFVTPKVDIARNALAERAISKVEKELADLESKTQKTRKPNEYSKDGGTASRTRIARSGVLANAVDTDGVLRTKGAGGAVEQYRSQTVDGVEGVVRQNLEREGKTINVAEVEKRLKNEVAQSGLEGADLVSALAGITREIDGLKIRANELGEIPLYKVHDAKISTTNNIDFNTPPETKTYRKAVAKAYKKTVEEKSSWNVADVNAVLAKFLDDIERLKRLDGMRVKGGRLGKYSAQLSGNLIGGATGAIFGPMGAGVGATVGGELAGVLKGKAMSRTFNAPSRALPRDPILERAKADATLPPTRPLTEADPIVGLPKDAPKTKEAYKLERDLKENVNQQKSAIQKGDFTLVKALKEVYDVLKEEMNSLVSRKGEGGGT